MPRVTYDKFSLLLSANAEDIRTKGHKNISTSSHTGMDLRPYAHKNIRGYAVAFNAIVSLFMTLYVLTA